jgi:hypothetical protein
MFQMRYLCREKAAQVREAKGRSRLPCLDGRGVGSRLVAADSDRSHMSVREFDGSLSSIYVAWAIRMPNLCYIDET